MYLSHSLSPTSILFGQLLPRTACSLQPDLLAVRGDADLGTCSAAASGASKAACEGTCVQNKQAYKEAGTCAIYACASSRLTTHTTARAHAY